MAADGGHTTCQLPSLWLKGLQGTRQAGQQPVMPGQEVGSNHYDVVVIGAGSGGLTAAKTAARFGARALLVERLPRLGGDCTWFGCVPSKALIRCAHAAHEARNGGRFGVAGVDPEAVRTDWQKVKQHIKSCQEKIYKQDDSPEVLQASGVHVRLGYHASFVDARTLQLTPVDETQGRELVSAAHFILCTGASPSLPPLAGLDKVPYLTYAPWQVVGRKGIMRAAVEQNERAKSLRSSVKKDLADSDAGRKSELPFGYSSGRLYRHWVFAVMSTVWLLRGTCLMLPAAGLKIVFIHLVWLTAIYFMCYASRNHPGDRRWDVMFCICGFFMAKWVTESTRLFKTHLHYPAHMLSADSIAAFCVLQHTFVFMGTNSAVLVVWNVCVMFLSDLAIEKVIRDDLMIVCLLTFILNALLEKSQAESMAAQAEALVQRRERLEQQKQHLQQCLSLVFSRIKAPVMLAKSELATTASYKQKVKCSVERFDQIWALLTGLRKELEMEFLDPEPLGHAGRPTVGSLDCYGPLLHPIAVPASSAASTVMDRPAHEANADCSWQELDSVDLSARVLMGGDELRTQRLEVSVGSTSSSSLMHVLGSEDKLQGTFENWLQHSVNALYNEQQPPKLPEDCYFELPFLGAIMRASAVQVVATQ
ncbi:unnamed protein product, partial [Effrenium voratum]